jgi:hypothetical protein
MVFVDNCRHHGTNEIDYSRFFCVQLTAKGRNNLKGSVLTEFFQTSFQIATVAGITTRAGGIAHSSLTAQ